MYVLCRPQTKDTYIPSTYINIPIDVFWKALHYFKFTAIQHKINDDNRNTRSFFCLNWSYNYRKISKLNELPILDQNCFVACHGWFPKFCNLIKIIKWGNWCRSVVSALCNTGEMQRVSSLCIEVCDTGCDILNNFHFILIVNLFSFFSSSVN